MHVSLKISSCNHASVEYPCTTLSYVPGLRAFDLVVWLRVIQGYSRDT